MENYPNQQVFNKTQVRRDVTHHMFFFILMVSFLSYINLIILNN